MKNFPVTFPMAILTIAPSWQPTTGRVIPKVCLSVVTLGFFAISYFRIRNADKMRHSAGYSRITVFPDVEDLAYSLALITT